MVTATVPVEVPSELHPLKKSLVPARNSQIVWLGAAANFDTARKLELKLKN